MNRRSSRKSRKNASKDVAGKKRKSSGGEVDEEQPSSPPPAPATSPPPAPATERNDDTEGASAAAAATVDVSALQKEIKKMEQGHQYFTSKEEFKFKVKFFVVKFEDIPPDYAKSEYACIPTKWVRQRNPPKKDGGRTALTLLPRLERDYREFSDVQYNYDPYKVLFCYSAVNLSEAQQYLDKIVLLEKELEKQNEGQPAKKKPKYAYRLDRAYFN